MAINVRRNVTTRETVIAVGVLLMAYIKSSQSNAIVENKRYGGFIKIKIVQNG